MIYEFDDDWIIFIIKLINLESNKKYYNVQERKDYFYLSFFS